MSQNILAIFYVDFNHLLTFLSTFEGNSSFPEVEQVKNRNFNRDEHFYFIELIQQVIQNKISTTRVKTNREVAKYGKRGRRQFGAGRMCDT